MKRENSGNKSGRPPGRPSTTGRGGSNTGSFGPRKTSSTRSGAKPKGDGERNYDKPFVRKASGGRDFESGGDRKPRTTGGYKKDSAPRSYGRKSEEGSFERKPRTTGGFKKDSAPRSYGRKSEEGSFERKPRTTGGYKKDSAPRSYGRKSEEGSFERKPRTTGGYKKDAAPRTFGEKRKYGGGSKETSKKAYGSSDSFAARKEMKSIRELPTDEKGAGVKRFDKRGQFSENTAGKGKFTKKSELKGFRPRISKSDSEEDFRFKKPGSKGKEIDFGAKDSFVSKSKSQSKERVTEEALSVGESVRLNRFISNAGVCSRREADELIGAGLVSINGQVVTELGTKVKAGDVVRFNGEKLSVEAKVYLILNKPKDAITTADDPDGRNTVMDIFDGKMRERIFPVGRLDRNTTGVLLLTNDGELAQRLMHPKYEVKKVYKATLNKNLKPADLWNLSNGVELEDGFIKPDALAQSDAKNKNVVGIEIHSGKNRIIHRMFEHLGYTVDKLDRALYAGLEKGTLKRGEWRELNEKELKNLKRMVQLK